MSDCQFWFAFGASCGTCFGAICLLIASISDGVTLRRKHEAELRQMHDQGYTDGRTWRGYEKVWLEVELERISESIARLEKIQEYTNGRKR